MSLPRCLKGGSEGCWALLASLVITGVLVGVGFGPKACARPKEWCTRTGALYSEVDCDQDGILDPKCTDLVGGDSSFLGSSSGCSSVPSTGICAGEEKTRCAMEGASCFSSQCCADSRMQCFELDRGWAECQANCTPGVDRGMGPWTCKVLSPKSTSMRPQPSASSAKLTQSMPITGADAIFAAGTGGTVAGDQLTLRHNAGFSMVSSHADAWSVNNFALFKLLGRTISFTVDLSQVGCACNVAAYLISSPARDPSGQPSRGSCSASPYYCDANQVCGQWCPEIDLMEANNRVLQATLHKCDPPTSTGYYSDCDRDGCGQNTRDQPHAYGLGLGFQIDTTHPFVVHTTFISTSGTLTGMRTVLEQEGRQIELSHRSCNPDYLAQLSSALATGMVLRITYWGAKPETMAWLDVAPCGNQACGTTAAEAYIGNITVTPVEDVVVRLGDTALAERVLHRSLSPMAKIVAYGLLPVTSVYLLAVLTLRCIASAISRLRGPSANDDQGLNESIDAAINVQAREQRLWGDSEPGVSRTGLTRFSLAL